MIHHTRIHDVSSQLLFSVPQASLSRTLAVLALVWALGSEGAMTAWAFKLTPMKMTLAPSGREANGVFTVSNDSNDTLAVDVHVLSRNITEDGVEVNEVVDNQFMVFPPQFALKPNSVQTIRVRWLGREPVKKELAFRLVAEQLPVSLSREANGGVELNVALRYLAAVYVRPKGASPDVSLAVVADTASSEPHIELLFDNSGTRHVFMENLSVDLTCGGETVGLSNGWVERVAGENLLAGARRRIRLAWPKGLPVGKPRAAFTFDR